MQSLKGIFLLSENTKYENKSVFVSWDASCQPCGFNEGLVVGINPYTKHAMRLVLSVT